MLFLPLLYAYFRTDQSRAYYRLVSKVNKEELINMRVIKFDLIVFIYINLHQYNNVTKMQANKIILSLGIRQWWFKNVKWSVLDTY